LDILLTEDAGMKTTLIAARILFACTAAIAIGFGTPDRAGAAATGATGGCIGDADGDGQVTVNELVGAVNNALTGCDLVPVVLNFSAAVGEEPFSCGNIYHGVGASGADLIPADFRFYIHNVRLIRSDGREAAIALDQDGIWQFENVALLDFEDRNPPCAGNAAKNTSVRGIAPRSDYEGVRFVLGVPFALNHQNAATAPPPLNFTAMFWNWQGGYKFLRVDDALDTVRVHLGSTGCVYGEPDHITGCARPNRGEILLSGFDPDRDTIVVDLAELFADFDLHSNTPDTAPGCESSPMDLDCHLIFRNLGINFENGLPDPSRQRVFRVRFGG
jgi:uncharacterized repeat protein (TIGR04052 family)